MRWRADSCVRAQHKHESKMVRHPEPQVVTNEVAVPSLNVRQQLKNSPVSPFLPPKISKVMPVVTDWRTVMILGTFKWCKYNVTSC
jgi:hypothetical protein